MSTTELSLVNATGDVLQPTESTIAPENTDIVAGSTTEEALEAIMVSDAASISLQTAGLNDGQQVLSSTAQKVEILYQESNVTSWWRSGGRRSTPGSLCLVREHVSTYDERGTRPVLCLVWSPTIPVERRTTKSERDKVSGIKFTRRMRQTLSKDRASSFRVPLEHCYAVHRAAPSVLVDCYNVPPAAHHGGAPLTAKQAAPHMLITNEQRQAATNSTPALVTVLGVMQKGLKSHSISWTFAFADNETADKWVQRIREGVFGPTGKPKHANCLVLLNPFGGTRAAILIYQQVVKPMAELAGVHLELVETERAKHATEYAQTVDLTNIDAIISVSGDGLFHEIINGLLSRDDWETARHMPLGIIPAGTGNALAISIDQPTPELGMVALISGSTRPLDIMALTPLKTGRTYYAHEMITWTIVADVDIESERFRWAGAARFTVSAVVRIFNLRKYRAKIYYLLHSHDPNANETDLSVEDTTSPSNESDGVVSNGPPLKLTNFCRQRRDTDDAPLEIPDGWKTYDGTIVHFIASSIPWISSDAYISPKAGISSGHIDLVWASETNDSLKMLSVLTDSGKGDYLHIPGIHWHQVRALIIEPMGRARNADIKGIMDVDGEVVPCEATAVECLPGLMTMITPAWFDEAKVARRHVYEKKQRQQQQKAQK